MGGGGIVTSICYSRFEKTVVTLLYTKLIYSMNQQQLKYDFLI